MQRKVKKIAQMHVCSILKNDDLCFVVFEQINPKLI